jgi:hypothetical protein
MNVLVHIWKFFDIPLVDADGWTEDRIPFHPRRAARFYLVNRIQLLDESRNAIQIIW